MESTNNTLRVLTWNIHGGKGLDFRHDIHRIGKILHELNADIVALQEVDLRKKSIFKSDILEFLKDKIGKYSCHAWTITEKFGNYGHVLISKYPLDCHLTHNISVAHREPRSIIEAMICLSGIKFRVIAVHLGIGIKDKHFQLRKLREIILNNKELPIILLGDFNEWWGAHVDVMLSGQFQESRRPRSYPSFLPAISLDRISCSHKFEIIRINSISSAWFASDHLPIVADLKFVV